jgi:hypothetical protein
MTTDDLFSAKAATKAAKVPPDGLLPNPKGRLKEQFHEVARFKHFSQRTEEAYWHWVVSFLKFHRVKVSTPHPGPRRHQRQGHGVLPQHPPTGLFMLMTFNPAINGWAIFSEACRVMAKCLRDVCGFTLPQNPNKSASAGQT